MHVTANLRFVERSRKEEKLTKRLLVTVPSVKTDERFFSFAEGHLTVEKSIAFLSTLLAMAKARLFDRATWRKVTRWVRQHNRQAKQEEQGVQSTHLFITFQVLG